MEETKTYIDLKTDDGRIVPLRIETEQLIKPTLLAQNVAINIVRDVPRFAERPGFLYIKSEPLAIVAAGPSLNETIDKVRGFKNVLVCGSAHDHLVRLGVIPTYALVSDGGKEDKGNLSLLNEETTYIIASQCDPSMFDHLSGYKVEMWHYRGQLGTPEEEKEIFKGEMAIAWGSTVTINSVSISMMLGFQQLHFFGFDSCYGDYGLKSHCAEIAGGMEYQKVPVNINGEERTFITDMGLMAQAEQFFRLMEVDGQFFHSTIYGDGMIAAMVRHGDPGLSTYVSLA